MKIVFMILGMVALLVAGIGAYSLVGKLSSESLSISGDNSEIAEEVGIGKDLDVSVESIVKEGISQSASGEAIDMSVLQEVQAHSSEDDCWIMINGRALDITSIVNSHPGGKGAIVDSCGKEVTTIFEGVKKHMNPAVQNRLVDYIKR